MNSVLPLALPLADVGRATLSRQLSGSSRFLGRLHLTLCLTVALAGCGDGLTAPASTTPPPERTTTRLPELPSGAAMYAAPGVSIERQSIVGRTHTSHWAYHTPTQAVESGERWYISRIHAMVPGEAYSLGPIENGQAAWWTIGTQATTFNSALNYMTFAPNLDTDPSNSFYDAGLKRTVTNSRIHADRRGLQGRSAPVKWYFFEAVNGLWYIVNAPSYGTRLIVLRFASLNGEYDWQPVDVSGVTVSFTPAHTGDAMRITFEARPMSVLSSSVWLADGTQSSIYLAQYNSNAPIDATRRTWVLIHGRLNGPEAMDAIAAAIKQRLPSDQVLLLSWESAARETLGWRAFSAGEQWIEPVGRWAAGMLTNNGFDGSRVNLVGHSWGAYVADEFAETMGGVNLLIALDPAANTIGSSFNPNDPGTINFRAHSRHSLAFHSSSWYGNERTPGSAHEAFSVAFYQPVGDVSQSNRHSWIKDLFVGMLSVQGAVSNQFSLQRLLAGTAGPWQSDRYQSDEAYGAIWPATKRYEGLVASGPASRAPRELRYFNSAGIEQLLTQ